MAAQINYLGEIIYSLKDARYQSISIRKNKTIAIENMNEPIKVKRLK